MTNLNHLGARLGRAAKLGSRLRTGFRGGLAACALVAATCGAAKAQYVFDDEIMPPRAVVWRLSERGFSEIGRPRFDGRVYVVDALGPNGAQLRLFIDPEDGGIVGRQRLDGAIAPVARIAPRPVAPGYGWTEDDAASGGARLSSRPVPPADIPGLEGRVPRRAAIDPAPRRDANDPSLYGGNPEAGRIGAPKSAAPKKVARVNPAKPVEKASPRVTPEAPAPVQATTPEVKPEAPVAAVEQPKAAPVAPPAAVQPPAEKAAEAKPADKSAEKAWSDPPADGKRPVRVIGGATVVPGTTEKDAGAAQ